MRKIVIFTFLFLNACLTSYAQKSQVLNPSGFTHNYIVSSLKYIEDRKDTMRLRYIACLRISDTDEPGEMPVLELMRIKAKELGADCFYLASHSETENSREMIVKLFFGGEKFLKDNNKKQVLNSIFIFNQTRVTGDTAVFYLNGKQEAFGSQKIYTKALALKEPCSISINQDNITKTEVVFKKAKKARFFILPENKKSIVLGQPRYVGISANGLSISVRRNSLYEMDYDSGRFWLDFYQ